MTIQLIRTRLRFYHLAIVILMDVSTSVLAQHPEFPQTKTIQVDVNGHKMRLSVAGNGIPAVVFVSGLGDGLGSWSNVYGAISQYTCAITYDRAGIGLSEASSETPTYFQIASDLKHMLHNAGIAPPYVLVGHSFGGAVIRAYSHLFKNDVSGLVFDDPVFENMLNGMTEAQIIKETLSQDSMLQGASPGILAEWKYLQDDVLKTFQALKATGSLPKVPMALIVAGKDRPVNWVMNMLDWYKTTMLQLSDQASIAVDPLSGHYIQQDNPPLLINSILRVTFPDIESSMRKLIIEKGVDHAIQQFRKYPSVVYNEYSLNKLGYEHLHMNNLLNAIELFKLNVTLFPYSSNPYDSLAEAYMKSGNKKLAIKNYEKSISLNPDNTNAKQMIETLSRK